MYCCRPRSISTVVSRVKLHRSDAVEANSFEVT